MCENCIDYKYLIAIIIIYNVVYRTLQPSKENTPIVEEPFQEQRPPAKRELFSETDGNVSISVLLKGNSAVL